MNAEAIAVPIVITEIAVFQVNSSHAPIKKTDKWGPKANPSKQISQFTFWLRLA